MTSEIEQSDVLETAMRLVRDAHSTIQMTMQAIEEIERPLPPEYFALLERKMNEGVKVTRIGFGRAEDFERIFSRVHIQHPNYLFHRTDQTDYRRMLLIDGSQLLFVRKDDTGRHIYLSDEREDLERYTRYFSDHEKV
ncbi:hypothetical protein HY970_01730 [Candidatus Kaiserbacteria bacterium]|nr:hypothetical protein [Candidatus Kaiserbacteria bacterium]